MQGYRDRKGEAQGGREVQRGGEFKIDNVKKNPTKSRRQNDESTNGGILTLHGINVQSRPTK